MGDIFMKLKRCVLKSIHLAALALATCVGAHATTDNIDLPFRDDPEVIGTWKSIAFVESTEGFVPDTRPADTELFLKELAFLPQGHTSTPIWTWTQGVLISTVAKTASKYTFEDIGGLRYMFLQWKGGDYTRLNRAPGYYVLVRDLDFTRVPTPMQKVPAPQQEVFDEHYYECLVDSSSAGGICTQPSPSTFRPQSLTALPHYDSNSAKMWQLDLRKQDILKLSLEGRTADLLYADFDTETKFPKYLPNGFAPKAIMELGKNPGLGLRKLHQEGNTGKGVAIAIIDQPLLVDHPEYAQRLKSFEEIHLLDPRAQMHGEALASIAVGKNSGVAPGTDVYYIANNYWDRIGMNYISLAKAISRIVAFNEVLPKGQKIRALAIARGFEPSEKGYAELATAIDRAKKAGIFVVSSSLQDHYGFSFNGLGREPMANPERPASYGPGIFWQNNFFQRGVGASSTTLLVPMDSRTVAAPDGTADYVFYRQGGWSWAIPYITGLYALACQVKPDITPELFWKKALETGDSVTIKKDGKQFRLERVVNPRKLIQSLKRHSS